MNSSARGGLRLGVSVEGQTEEQFVKKLLAPHLAELGVFAMPVIVSTSRSASSQKAKGGGINVDRVVNELRCLLGSFHDGFVTTLYDFYAFGGRMAAETVGQLETRIAEKLGFPANFISYIQLHEFEALLLSDAAIVSDYFNADELQKEIARAVGGGSPEQVNNGPETAPSKRLDRWTSRYAPRRRYWSGTKTTHGPLLAARLTLPVIRAACPRFNAWLTRLESLSPR